MSNLNIRTNGGKVTISREVHGEPGEKITINYPEFIRAYIAGDDAVLAGDPPTFLDALCDGEYLGSLVGSGLPCNEPIFLDLYNDLESAWQEWRVLERAAKQTGASEKFIANKVIFKVVK